MPARQFPFRPHLDQLRNQAKDLLRDVRAEAPSALDDFREFHPGRIDPAIAALADAQLVLARSYGASSWPSSPLPSRRSTPFRTTIRGAARGRRGAPGSRPRPRSAARRLHAPLAKAADAAIRRVMMQLRERGVDSADGLLARPDLQPVLDTLRLLGRLGGSPAGDWVGGSVEVLRGYRLRAVGRDRGRRAGTNWDGPRWRSRRTRDIRQESIASSR